MTTSIRMRGELPFPQAGEGVILRFTNTDCDGLQKKFGDNWFQDCVPRLNRFDTEYMRECIAWGGKKDGKPFRINYDELNIPVAEIAESVLDSLFLAMHGRTWEDHLNYIDSMSKVEVKKGDSEGNA